MADKKDDSRADAGAMRIDPALVRELAELLTANELPEIEVEDGDRKIKVAREPAALIAAPAAAPPPSTASAPAAASAAPAPSAPEVSGETLKSPMVGTAFLSAEPGAKPFVTVGQAVKAGDTVLIVEAMKVMNPITAPTAGTVKQILIADGHPVEFDQPLMIIG
ncbi:acetyl-CoA carboxylase biotin carboxyl carrier protein [Sphingomonas sp.]|uniref:acetyl-CoA carboxylase biotin carboxyl carrier protein n=1 Tax=Sphingomonas sp. TaxID=28214 RepID=UPI00286E45A4|nr:acetyl-CoA carboxylase biotin carboxyl carrier protein [Sphingomonas sp.]